MIRAAMAYSALGYVGTVLTNTLLEQGHQHGTCLRVAPAALDDTIDECVHLGGGQDAAIPFQANDRLWIHPRNLGCGCRTGQW